MRKLYKMQHILSRNNLFTVNTLIADIKHLSKTVSVERVMQQFKYCIRLKEERELAWAMESETEFLSVWQDAFAKGEVFLGHRDHGYRVTIGLPAGTHYTGTWQYAITIETPDRSFLFTCETDTEQKDWMSHFNAIISTPMSPQEYTGNTSHTHMNCGDFP